MEPLVIIFSVLFTLTALIYLMALIGFFSQYFSLKKQMSSNLKKNTKKKKNTLLIMINILIYISLEVMLESI